MELQYDLDSMHREHEWETACAAPCDRYLASDSPYRLVGGGRKASDEFALMAPDGGGERIRVSGGSKAWFVLGWIGIGVGGGVAAVGFDVLIGPLVSEYIPAGEGRPSSQGVSGHPALGWSLVGGGLALGIGSTLLMLAHRKTTVTQDVTPAAAPAAWLRLDLDQRRDTLDARIPRGTWVPLLSGVF
jgi:hypothetical protein